MDHSAGSPGNQIRRDQLGWEAASEWSEATCWDTVSPTFLFQSLTMWGINNWCAKTFDQQNHQHLSIELQEVHLKLWATFILYSREPEGWQRGQKLFLGGKKSFCPLHHPIYICVLSRSIVSFLAVIFVSFSSSLIYLFHNTILKKRWN